MRPTPPQHPISKADLARRSGRSRAAITQACSGPLAPAVVGLGRIDVAHPAVAVWARARGIDPALLVDAAPSVASTPSRRPVGQDATFFVKLSAFARIAGESLEQLDRAALEGSVLPLIGGGEAIDLGDELTLTYLAARPFKRNAKREIISPGPLAKMLPTACVKNKVNVEHPIARAFLARARGDLVVEPAS